MLAGAILSVCFALPAHAANKVKIGVLKFGTVSWLLDTIQANGFDKAEGIELDIVPLASTQATTVGLQGGSVDVIATDWLWVSRDRAEGFRHLANRLAQLRVLALELLHPRLHLPAPLGIAQRWRRGSGR